MLLDTCYSILNPMPTSKLLKGSLYIALGASSYGMLATFVRLAYDEGFSTAEVTLSQYALGFAGLFILTFFRKRQPETGNRSLSIKSIGKLILAGTSMGLTSVSYYMSVQYVPVSVAIVLLMQTVWMGVVLEMILEKRMPGLRKLLAVVIILAGTVLATNMLGESVAINWPGFGWGLLAAMAYTATMYSSNHISLNFPPLRRSLYMILGGLILLAVIFHSSINLNFSSGIFLRWGLVLSLFGTILPPLLFNKGMPLTGMGLGAIIASIEIPVSILMASILLREPVSFLQWIGVAFILAAVVVMNWKKGEEL